MTGAPRGPRVDTLLPAARAGARSFTICATIFLVVAAALAVVRATTPIDRGWWLVAYLSLVGGVAQLMLGPGLIALAGRRAAPAPGSRALLARLVLWNAGTVLVAAADLAGAIAGVLAGSALLLAALALFTGDLRAVGAAASGAAPWWVRGYGFLLVFLVASVAVGTALSYRGR